MPLMVHSIWRAPICTAPMEFATERPRSSWQCTEMMAWSMFGTRLNRVWMMPENSVGTV
ncbi:hypothetical protein D3C79_953890 [compost metagenome]